MPSSAAETPRRRARPCFGSFLVVAIDGLPRDEADAAITRAFALAERFHDAMSRQSETSDLAAIARLRPGERETVSPETHDVLAFALTMAEDTDGLFDPVEPGAAGRDADWRDLSLDADGAVRVRRPLRVSLDGVAKGFAADRLAAILRGEGARDVVVDAGGDLALACDAPQEIALRDPRRPSAAARVIRCAQGGVASSAGYGGISELWGANGRRTGWPRAVTVVAPDCATADALTKVLALDPYADDVLARWGAEAHVLAEEDAACRR
jgi:thiamine biosynthesis lipoprotein